MSELLAWMRGRVEPSAPSLVVTALAFYSQFSLAGEWQNHVSVITLALLVAQLVRAPRWVVYGLLVSGFACVVAQDVFVASTGQQDPGSDRDEAVEIACRALLHGRNPWGRLTPLHNPVSTGPTSIVIALPFVALTGRIDTLTFLFWLTVAICLVGGDRMRLRDSAIILVQLLQLGFFDTHTMRYWALDELSFAVLLFLVAWRFAAKGRFALVGVALAAAVLSRASYLFPVVGFMGWMRWELEATWRQLSRVVVASAATALLVVGALVICFHKSIGRANPIAVSVGKASSPIDGGSDLTELLGWVSRHIAGSVLAPLRVILAGLLVLGFARLLARLRFDTPLIYVTVGNVAAFTVVHYAGRFADNYTGPIVIAAALSIAFAASPRSRNATAP